MDFSTDIRAKEASDNNSRKKDAKQNAEKSLQSEEVRANLIRKIDDGGSFGRRLDRELRRTESTGRISNWLANQTTKAELSVGRQRQQAFDELVSSVSQAIESPVAAPFGGLRKNKAEVPSTGGAETQQQPWDIYVISQTESSYKIGVRAGTLNGFLAENWKITKTVGKNELIYGKVKISTNGQKITSISISLDSSPPKEQEPQAFSIEQDIEFLFGLFSGGNKYRTVASGHIVLEAKRWIIASANPPAEAGESPYEFYFYLA